MDINLEINNVVHLSRSHISVEGLHWLGDLCRSHKSCESLVGYQSGDTYILYCMSFEMLHAERHHVPVDILNLVAFANALHCDVILINTGCCTLGYLNAYGMATGTTFGRPTTYKMLTLSTGHISEATRALLTSGTLKNVIADTGFQGKLLDKNEYGWFIFGLQEALRSDVPADLSSIISYACHNGCDAVCLDCDGHHIDNLQWFDD